jgi:hypothetical protein
VNLKGKLYDNNPHTTEVLQNKITHIISSVPAKKTQGESDEVCLKAERLSFPAALIKYGKFLPPLCSTQL